MTAPSTTNTPDVHIDVPYAPYPERELAELAMHLMPAEAAHLRNATQCFDELRDRALTAEMERRVALYRVRVLEARLRSLGGDVS